MSAPKYDVHPSVAMIQKWTMELPEKTGRGLQEWSDLVTQLRTTVRKERIAWLKESHGLGTNTAIHIVNYAEDRHTWDGDPEVYLQQAVRYVDAMFAGKKAELKPIFDVVLKAVRKLGKDVKVCPCKTIIPFYRKRVFAQLKPGPRSRLELGLVLEDTPCEGLLQPNARAAENDRLKHLIPLASIADFNEEALAWLKTAYDRDA